MPPKKKKSGKKKKKKDDGEMTIDDKYKKTLDEIEALKDHLAIRKEYARRSVAASEDWKDRMEDAQQELELHQQDQKAVSADMTRQYKTMQTEMGMRIHHLETELTNTRAKLEETQQALKASEESKARMEKEKDDIIADLNVKIDQMEQAYEHLLDDAFDRLVLKVDGAKRSWEDNSTMIQSHNKQILLEFGLNPLHI